MTKAPNVRFDRTGPTIVVEHLAVTDPAIVAEAHFWADGHRGSAATSEQLAAADLSNYVVQAMAVGAQAIAPAGLRTELTRLLKRAAAALAYAETEGGASDVAA